MKSLSLPVPALFIGVIFTVILIHLFRLQIAKGQRLPVSVTSSSAAVEASVPVAPVSELPYFNDDVLEPIPGYPGLAEFAVPLLDGRPGVVVGVYVPDLFALPVDQQPANQADYVTREADRITQFGLPKKYGSTGLLAHNYLSGKFFARLENGQDIILVYGDGQIEHYRVTGASSFQALKPESPYSNFIDLADPSRQVMSSADLFNQVYTHPHQLVFQTCIEAEGEPSWGRLFVTATLAEPVRINTIPTFAGQLAQLN